jgi:uncharacterized membrane protein YfcA
VRPTRRNTLLIALATGVVFLVGLFVHGPVGGVLLLLVAAMLVLLSTGAWQHVRRDGRPLRVLMVAVVVVLAILKLARKL